MKSWKIAVVCAGLALSFGCIGSAPVAAPKAPITAEFKAPLSLQTAPLPPGKSEKIGRATTKCYLSLVTVGDMSIDAAKRNGGIETITHIDYEYLNGGLFMYQEMTTVVYGY